VFAKEPEHVAVAVHVAVNVNDPVNVANPGPSNRSPF
jgi:hypothetical protein